MVIFGVLLQILIALFVFTVPAGAKVFLAIYAAVIRESDDGIFEPAQAISVTEALKMWTV